eukprot:Clim_evm60s232 gene=Clim_evmTU60s232
MASPIYMPPALRNFRMYVTLDGPEFLADEGRYNKYADECLEALCADFEDLENIVSSHEFDVQYSSGVLTMILGDDKGTYVINKQTPNRQIWLSSPKSGPKRYDYDSKAKKWIYSHDGIALHDLLEEELSAALGEQLTFEVGLPLNDN